MADRRPKGTGSIATQASADGSWRGYVTLPNGGRKKLRAATQAQLRALVAAELRKIEEGRPPPLRDATVAEYLAGWLSRRLRHLAPSTVERYEQLVRLHVAPYHGNRRVSTIRVTDIEWLHDELRARRLSESTIHRVHTLLHTAYKDAERRGEITRNPCSLLDPPKDSPRVRRPLAVDDVAAILRAARGDDFEALYWLAAFAGLRQSELFGLRWSDIDLDAQTLAIPSKIRRITGLGIRRSRPKTQAGDRVMALAGIVVTMLHDHRARQRAAGRPNPLDLVFPNQRGGYHQASNWNRRAWYPFLARAGVTPTEFRELTRKAAGSLMVAANVDAATLRRRMGHASAETTLDWYVRSIDTADRAAARSLDRALRKLAGPHRDQDRDQ